MCVRVHLGDDSRRVRTHAESPESSRRVTAAGVSLLYLPSLFHDPQNPRRPLRRNRNATLKWYSEPAFAWTPRVSRFDRHITRDANWSKDCEARNASVCWGGSEWKLSLSRPSVKARFPLRILQVWWANVWLKLYYKVLLVTDWREYQESRDITYATILDCRFISILKLSLFKRKRTDKALVAAELWSQFI